MDLEQIDNMAADVRAMGREDEAHCGCEGDLTSQQRHHAWNVDLCDCECHR
jgi:hypothetical protein